MELSDKTVMVESRLQFVLDNTPDIVWAFDVRKFQFSYVSPAVEQMLGYSQEESTRLHFSDWMPAHSVEKVQKLIEDGIPYFKEYGEYSGVQDLEVFHKDGHIVWIELVTRYRIQPETGDLEIVGSTRDITRIKELEEKNAKDRALLHEAAQLARLGAWEYDVQIGKLIVSDEWLEIHGLDAEHFDYSMSAVYEVIHPEDAVLVKERFENIFVDKVIAPLSFRIVLGSDEVRYLMVSGRVDLGYDGEVKRIYGFTQDVTAHKRAEIRLVESEMRHRSILENMPIVCFTFDREGKILSWNKESERVYGYTKKEAIGKSSYDLIVTPATYSQTQVVVKSVFEGEAFLNNEWLDRDKDGRLGWRSGNAFPVRNSEGKVLYGVNMNVDITEQKEMLGNLKESEEKYRQTFDMAPIAIAELNEKGFVRVNEQFCKMFDYSGVELLRMGLKDLALLDTAEGYEELVERVVRRHDEGEIERKYVTKKGEILCGATKVTAIYDAGGDVDYLIVAIKDVTSEKQVRKQLEEHKSTLEHQVMERTEEIGKVNEELKVLNLDLIRQKTVLEQALVDLREAQAQLVQSEKMASIGVLTAGIAHEINNPLNYIQGGVSAIGMYMEDFAQEHLREVEPMLNSVKEGVRRAADIVRSFNKFSRRDDDRLTRCDVNDIIDHCLTMVKSETRGRIEVVKNYTKAEYDLMANEGKLHQIFINLLLNASQAIKKEGVIKISTKKTDKGIRVTVVDSGPGIPDVYLSKVYDPFFTTKPPGEGTGLGLYITAKLVKDHNGILTLKNRPEGGVEAVVQIPLNN